MSEVTTLTTINDVQTFDYQELRLSLSTELKVIDGVYYCTIRGLSRLLGISHSTLTDTRLASDGTRLGLLYKLKEWTLDRLPKSLKPVAGFDFKMQPDQRVSTNNVDLLLPETVIACVTKYYAYESSKRHPRAVQFDVLFSSMGIREFFAEMLGRPVKSNPVIEVHQHVLVKAPVVEALDADTRLVLVSNAMSVLSSANQEFQEQVLLTLLGLTRS